MRGMSCVSGTAPEQSAVSVLSPRRPSHIWSLGGEPREGEARRSWLLDSLVIQCP